MDDNRMDISDRFRPEQQYNFPASASVSGSTRDDDPSGPSPYAGPLDVTAMTQSVADQFVGAPRGLSAAMAPVGLASFMGLGAGISKNNLERIETKITEGETGFGLGMFNNRIIGVSPAPIGSGYVLSGVLPENLTPQQRNQLAQNILAARAPTFRDTEPERGPDIQTGYSVTSDPSFYDNERGRPGPSVNMSTDKARRDAALTRAVREADRDDSDNNQPKNEYSVSSPSDSLSKDYSAKDFSFEDTRMGRAEGGAVQRTGFVSGSPDNYTKAQTVADDENRQVREGAFVLNAPTVETLQRTGMLPKGVDKSNKNTTIKANKGGLMPVALSKGEYVIEPEEAQRIGYSFLEKINDQGKAEVDRRQAAADGGFINGYQDGGKALPTVLPQPSPIRQKAIEEEDIPLPEIPDSFRKKLIDFMKPIVDRDKKPNRTQINNFIKSLDAKEQLAFLFLTETTSNAAPIIEMENIGEVVFNRIESNYRDFSKLSNQQQVLLQHVNNNPKKAKQFSGLEPTIVFRRSKDVVKGLAEPGLRKAYAASENVLSDDPDRASLRRLPYATVFYTKKDADSQWMRESKDLEYAGEEGGHEFYRPVSISVSDAQKANEKYRYININPEFP